MSLVLSVLGPRDPLVDLDELIPNETAELLYEDQRGERTLAVSSTTADVARGLRCRVVTRYAADSDGWRAIDETIFHVDAEYFSEVEQRRAQGGPNLHLAPIRLPRVMRVGAWHQPIAGQAARVALAEHAWVRLQGGTGGAVELPAIAFLSAEGSQRGLQWSLLGIGEAWTGPPHGPPTRWLLGGRVGSRLILEPVPAETLAAPRRGLPADSNASPRRSVF